MESNKLDQLFKNKLDRHTSTPSADAWAMLESKLQHKKKSNKKVYWTSIAASICLLLVAFYVLQNKDSDQFTTIEDTYAVNIQEGEGFNSNTRVKTEFDKSIPVVHKEIKSAADHNKNEEKKEVKKLNTASFAQESMLLISVESKAPELAKVQAISPSADSMFNTTLNNSIHTIDPNLTIAETFIEKQEGTENGIIKTKDKIKSLASELSIADLRSAKNELFASALQFEKKRNN